MLTARLATLFFCFFALLGSAFGAEEKAAFKVPELTGPVVDEAGVLDASTKASLERALFALHDSGGSQINVVTITSLGGLEIEQAGIKIYDAWQLGSKKTDNGVILLVAPNERKVRIEVGRGLEGSLTDADSKRIIDQSILPLFRSGDFNSGILVGVYQITLKTDPTFDLKPYLEGHARAHSRTAEKIPLKFFVFLFILLIWLISRFGGGGGYRGGGFYSGGWGGGGWGGGGLGGGFGGGGGGWGGGGGSGNGGGASGGW